MTGSIHYQQAQYSFFDFSELDLTESPNPVDNDIQKFIKNWINDSSNFILQTSGSTGSPKTITVSRQQMTASALMTCETLCLKKGDNALLCIDPKYIGGKMMVVRAMVKGLNLTLVPSSADPSCEFDTIIEFDFAAFAPVQIQTLLKTVKGIAFLNSIKNIIIGGAAVSSEIEDQLQQIKTNVYSTYGMTETVSHIALKRINGSNRVNVFTALNGVELKLDERGCLKIKSEVTDHKWINTNDLVALVGNKSFKWVGRIDNVINSGGIKIQIEQLESRIRSVLPSLSFMITKRSDDKLGEIVVMLIDQKELSSKELAQLKQQLPKYHFPKDFFIVDKLPFTSSGKPDRKKAKTLAKTLAMS